MKLTFFKYHGTGNDFILLDGRASKTDLTEEQIHFLCNRHLGIGADGLINVISSESESFEMIYYNSDGRIGSMCGNGGRCAVAFARSLGLVGSQISFMAFDGIHKAKFISFNPDVIKLKMADVGCIFNDSDSFFLDTGSPHIVGFHSSVNELDIETLGKKIRYSNPYSEKGVNVNFVEVSGTGLFIRTYERGVEEETLSCGTGVTASVIAAVAAGKWVGGSPCPVSTPGGKLSVYFRKVNDVYSDIWLEGPAEFVFKGEIEIT